MRRRRVSSSDDFLEARSKGTFFNAHIKDEYSIVRVG
jgi:KTSC domain